MLVQPQALVRSMLDDLVVAGPPAGLLNGALVKLFKNDMTPSGLTLLADLDEADFTGYAASGAVTWDAGFTNEAGDGEIIGDTKQFLASGAAVANTVYGYYVTSGDGLTLLFSERFAVPKLIDAAGKSITVIPRFQMPGAGAATII